MQNAAHMLALAAGDDDRTNAQLTTASVPPNSPVLVKNSVLVVSIEGNIGAGKSTQMRWLKELLKDVAGVHFIDEPVDEWIEHGFLERMYNSASSIPQFQFMVLQSLAGDLANTMAQEPRPLLIVTERSPAGNLYTFANVNLTEDDYTMYKFTWDRCMRGMPEMTTKYIYLECDTMCLSTRIAQRGRGEETAVSAHYLDKLNDCHHHWLRTGPDSDNAKIVDAKMTAVEVFEQICGHMREWTNEMCQVHSLSAKFMDTNKTANDIKVTLDERVVGARAIAHVLDASSEAHANKKPKGELA